MVNQWGMRMGNDSSSATRKADGSRQSNKRPSHKEVPAWLRPGMHTGVQSKIKLPKPKGTTKKMYSRNPDGTRDENEHYDPPAIANPGNKIERTYTASEVAELLAMYSDVNTFNVGGGQMGHELAHENEAPFPVELPAFFIQSFCPPGGVVCDPFSGSGTTAQASREHGRRFVGCDIRESQVELARRRLATVTPGMFAGLD